jgi:hypothetical protein
MWLHMRKACFAAFCGALTLVSPMAASAQAVFTTAPGGGGQIVVNQSTGAVSYCVILSGGTALAPTPTGICAKIGTATPSATNPSLVVSEWFNGNSAGQYTSFVTNVYTGKVTQCEYYYNGNLHTIYGDCAVIGTASS